MAEGYAAARAITSPFRLPPSLAAPKAQPPPSTIPTDRLATQADHWADGRGVSPALPPPNGYTLQPKPASSSLTTLATQTLINQASHVAAQQQPQQPPPPPPPPPQQQMPPQHPASMHGYGPPPIHARQGGGMPQQQAQPYYYTPAPASGPYHAHQPPLPPMAIPPPPPFAQEVTPTPYFALPKDVHMSQQYAPPASTGYDAQQPNLVPQHPLTAPPPPPHMPIQQSMQMPAYHQLNGTIPPPPHPSASASAPSYSRNSGSGFVQRQVRTTSMVPPNSAIDQSIPRIEQLGLSNPGPPPRAPSVRPDYYLSDQDGPPNKLSVMHPDQRTLANLREAAYSGPNDMYKKIAWAKQVLKFVERQQSISRNSSRITDQTLVRWTDEALNLILSSAASSTPVPLALYFRGDLSSTGSFPSYRSKDSSAAFRDFEAASNGGLVKAWFRIGRAYEDFGDVRRAVNAYERGVEKGDCGSTYRLAMAYLLGQIGVMADAGKALALLRRAADAADVDTPQPPYILGLLLNGEFETAGAKLPQGVVPLNVEEAKWRIERAAYLAFGPAQYKMGYAYEYATLGCLFDPFLSVQYYALASQNGEVEADMALSKWYLCGFEGSFEKNEALAVTFAEKAAHRGLPSAEFALGYFSEVGISGPINLELAKRWYQRAAGRGNEDAQQRLEALQGSEENVLSRVDHESQLDQKLVRKRTQAQARSDEQKSRLAQTYARASAGSVQGGRGYGGTASAPPSQQAAYQSPRLSQSNGSSDTSVNTTPQMPSSPGTGSIRGRTRSDTLKQVEAAAAQAAGWGPRPMPNRNNTEASSSLQTSPAMGRLLQDGSANPNAGSGGANGLRRPSSTLPPSNSSTGGAPQRQEIATHMALNKPTTFAEMGIATTKAKKDECTIM
ncbi:BZ3500_MvSof-1268-A1-R1_Chr3-1g06116 [Microbotryum saponariae]|uniref:BZ3500_MvSof-1268-A1-R1_Chr3-1g06116 protein n=1 Tax=Microbotryum saponariae TaxID=289078 RepID=A0A2X0LDY7_9BASI|nr:BZ3500_MvSof-1268-A1-R1_Chr3-1g06116 [Microbotryum saponariae]SDA03979.1 BZ3501_MvSof-1269-A2-R1_Chr3-2g05801 [Microbotryum saponariae]